MSDSRIKLPFGKNNSENKELVHEYEMINQNPVPNATNLGDIDIQKSIADEGPSTGMFSEKSKGNFVADHHQHHHDDSQKESKK